MESRRYYIGQKAKNFSPSSDILDLIYSYFVQFSCGMLIKQIGKNANNILREQGLTFAQLSAMFAIRDFPERQISQKELENLLHVAQSTTAGIISRLEQKWLVVGFGDLADKRIKQCHPCDGCHVDGAAL